MNTDFLSYLQKLELMVFFSAYPVLYTVIVFFAGNQLLKGNLTTRMVSLLPFSYALVGTLFLGFQLKKLYPDYSVEHIKLIIHQPWLVIWGLLSILFWIPALAKRSALSLVHSLVFFLFLASDLFLKLSSSSSVDNSIITNDMKVYTSSLFLNLGAIAFLVLLSLLITYSKRHLISFSKRAHITTILLIYSELQIALWFKFLIVYDKCHFIV